MAKLNTRKISDLQ